MSSVDLERARERAWKRSVAPADRHVQRAWAEAHRRRIDHELARFSRYGHPFSIVVFEIVETVLTVVTAAVPATPVLFRIRERSIVIGPQAKTAANGLLVTVLFSTVTSEIRMEAEQQSFQIPPCALPRMVEPSIRMTPRFMTPMPAFD